MTWTRNANKFNARARCVCGVNVGSAKEGRRVVELLALQRAGEIQELEFHPKFELVVNGQIVGRFTPDSRYVTKDGEVIVEDVKGGTGSRKGTRTEAYSLRRRLFEAACWPLTVSEV